MLLFLNIKENDSNIVIRMMAGIIRMIVMTEIKQKRQSVDNHT